MDYLSMTGLSFAGKDARDTVLKDLFIATSALYKQLYGGPFEASKHEIGKW